MATFFAQPPRRLRRVALTTAAVVAVLAVLAGAGCARAPAGPPLPTVAQVDLQRYLGTWYEIALVPNRFQAMCVSDTQARYQRDGDDLLVLNSCRQADGSTTTAQGVAQVVAGSGNAKLRVSFFRPFYGDYWVLALADDYRWVLVGEPSRRYGWLLARTPTVPAADRETALARAQALGYARSAFVDRPHTP